MIFILGLKILSDSRGCLLDRESRDKRVYTRNSTGVHHDGLQEFVSWVQEVVPRMYIRRQTLP